METCSLFRLKHLLFIPDCLSLVIPASPHGVSSVYSDAEEPAVCSSFAPRTQRTKGCGFVHLLRCEGHRDREDVSPVNKAQPTHRALVSCCLFGISTEVLLHQTFLFKCCQHHVSVRQID